MDTSKPGKTDDQSQKPIGRQLEFVRAIKKEGVSPATVAIIVIITAVLAFVAGTRADQYALLDGAFSESTTNTELPEDLDYMTVERVYDELRQSYDGNLTETELLDGLKIGLAESTGDPYTTYLNAEQAEQFKDDLNGTFSGIGAEIGKDGEFIIIVAPLSGFPAEEAGLKAQDIVLEIDGEDATGLSIDEAVLKIRGKAGTDVALTVFSDGERKEVSVTRQTIVVPSVETEIVDGIGILRITRFAEDTTSLANDAADQFIKAGVKGIVLDLRNNSGGFLTTAVDVSSLWLDGKEVTQQRTNNGTTKTDTYTAAPGAELGDIPTVALINQGSASASEIVAGALQDYEKATIIGETSFGKGSVQDLRELPDHGVLKVTIARWYTPNGNNIDDTGIEPDKEVEYVEAEDDSDNQLEAALDFLAN